MSASWILNTLADESAGGTWLSDNWGWLVAAAFVVFGLFVIGAKDTFRFSLKRTWAISGVCFAESIRKRVLWITPLAIIGVIAVTQLERAIDQQDAIRQTIKYSLFATGMVVILTSIILACTNLPKEIESKVIFTVVTKPTTRLELVLGKVVGFARVSLAILVIMGLFTWGYLRLREQEKRSEIAHRLSEGDLRAAERDRLTHYQQDGLLAAASFRLPDSRALYGRDSGPNSKTHVISNDGDEELMAGCVVDRPVFYGSAPADISDEAWSRQGIGETGMVIRVELNSKRTGKATDQPTPKNEQSMGMGPFEPVVKQKPTIVPPLINIDLRDPGFFSFISGSDMVGATNEADLETYINDYIKINHVGPHVASLLRLADPVTAVDGTSTQVAYVWVPPQQSSNLIANEAFYVHVAGASKNVDYTFGPNPVQIFIPQMYNGRLSLFPPGATVVSLIDPGSKKPILVYRGLLGLHNDQDLHGNPDPTNGVAVYGFHNETPPVGRNGEVPFQLNVEITRGSGDIEEGQEDATTLDIRADDLDSGKSATRTVQIESRQPAYFVMPEDVVSGKNVELSIHCRNLNHIIGFYNDSLRLMSDQQSFEFNLVKSMSILWMMSILVIVLSIMSSTFLSWPIAVVLTVVLLLGHWAVNQVADNSGAGLGRRIVNDFKMNDIGVSQVVSKGVDSLSRTVSYVAKVLPDTVQFDAIEDLESGGSVSTEHMLDSLQVLIGFGLPALVAAYLILRETEVAP